MLVEINLLPRKERGSSTLLIAVIFLITLLLILISFFYWRNASLESKINSLNNTISLTEKVIVKEQGKVQGIQESDSIERLRKSIEWGSTYPIKTVPILRQLNSLLPDRGFLQSFSYSQTEGIKLLVQFDTSREAAYYLNRLNESSWVKEAKLMELISQQELETDGSSGLTADDLEQQGENDYLPRYVAEFQIQLNLGMVKELSEADSALLQEGAGE